MVKNTENLRKWKAIKVMTTTVHYNFTWLINVTYILFNWVVKYIHYTYEVYYKLIHNTN